MLPHRNWLIWPLLFGLTALSVPAQDQTKAKKGSAKKAPPEEKITAFKGINLGTGVFIGLAASVPLGDKLILRDAPPPKADELNKIKPKNLDSNQKQELKKAKQVIAYLNNLPRKEIEFTVAPEVPVRFKVLPQIYDDKGIIIVPTKEEKVFMKGLGIPGTLEQIRGGHIVRVEQQGEKGAAKIKMVTILGEAPMPNDPVPPAPKTKKK